jgi:hypothetical protein
MLITTDIINTKGLSNLFVVALTEELSTTVQGT